MTPERNALLRVAGWLAFAFALAAVVSVCGCLKTNLPAGATTCLQNVVMVSDGKYLVESTDCDATVPQTKCAAGSEGLAYCRGVAP